MTSTYTAAKNPWMVDGTLQKRLHTEAEARQLAGNAIDMLGIVSVYAGRDWEGNTHSGSKSLFPGRALVTKRSDPARKVRLPHVPFNHSSRMVRNVNNDGRNGNEESNYYYYEEQQDAHGGNNTNNSEQYYPVNDNQQQQQKYHQEYFIPEGDHQNQTRELGEDEQEQGFNEQFNREYFSNGRRRFNQYDFPQQQDVRNNNNENRKNNMEQHFQYANMDELDLLNNNNNNYNMISFDSRQQSSINQNNTSTTYTNSRQNSAFNRQVSSSQQPQPQSQQQDYGRNSPTHDEAYDQQIRVREEVRQQRMVELSQDQIREMQENDEISKHHGLYTNNSFRDIRLSRECKYGVGSRTLGDDDRLDETRQRREKRLARGEQEGNQDSFDEGDPSTFLTEEEAYEIENASPSAKRRKMREIAKRKLVQRIAAPKPLDARDYPVQPTTRSSLHDKPLVYCEGSGAYVCSGDAYGSFPSSSKKSSEIHQRMLDRKNGRSAALHKAIEEIKYNDRALLVNLPWQMTNHKSNQVYFMGGGNTSVAKFDFLEKNAVQK